MAIYRHFEVFVQVLHNIENKYNSIVVETTKGKTKNTRTKDKLIGIVYRNESDEKRSYDKVIIEKLLDNSIFDFLSKDSSNDLIEAIKNKLLNNENEVLVLKNKLEEIQKENKNIEEQRQQFNEIFEKSENLDNIMKAIIDKTKLGASISYWKEKQTSHFWKFIGFSISSVILIGLLIWILFSIVGNPKENNILEFTYSNFSWYILMIFASSSSFWIIRITVKIALSNLHLSEDAHERVVMIQTYLSFVQEGQIEEKDKQLIISSLFRPSNNGIIKDETSVTVADIITALKK